MYIRNDFKEANPEYRIHGFEGRPRFYGDFGNLNIFVGENNSGKSNFLRKLIKLEKVYCVYFSPTEFDKKLENFLASGFKNSSNNFRLIVRSVENVELPTVAQRFLNEQASRNNGRIEYSLEFEWFRKILENIKTAINTNAFDKLDLNIMVYISLVEIYGNIAKGEHNYPATQVFIFRSNDQESIPPLDLFEELRSFSDFFNTQVCPKNETEIDKIFISSFGNFDATQIWQKNETETDKIFIPVLRHAMSIYQGNIKASSQIFSDSVISNYQLGDVMPLEVFTGYELYEKVRSIRLSKKETRTALEEFEKFIGSTFFQDDNFEINAVQGEGDVDSHLSIFLRGKELDIHELGDGIQALIILLFPIYMAKDNSWIFIEEPETHLHPGMQRIFVEQLCNSDFLKKKNLRYFITTHSNHLLDISIEGSDSLSVFQFRKDDGDIRYIKPTTTKDIETLKLLGVNNSSVLLANKAIWVEGHTDRRYIELFLEQYINQHNKPKLKKDIDYAYFEYAGSNVVHYFFDEDGGEGINALALHNDILLIADKDTGKEERHENLRQQAENNPSFAIEILSVKEIENLLSHQQIISILKEFNSYSSDVNTEKRFGERNLTDDGLGKILKTHFKTKVPKLKAESGTLSSYYKNKFCDIAEKEKLVIWDNMTEQARQLAERVYQFISGESE